MGGSWGYAAGEVPARAGVQAGQSLKVWSLMPLEQDFHDLSTFYIGCLRAMSSIPTVRPALFHTHARSLGKHVALTLSLYDWHAPAAV